MPNREMVRLTWVDACFGRDEPYLPPVLNSLGYLYEQNEKHTTIAMESPEEDGDKCRDFLTVPNEYIREITYLIPRGTE